MNCIVLAAGYATRLYPLTRNFPKPLLEVAGETILDRLLDDAVATGEIERCVVVSNARFAEIFRNWRDKKLGDSTRFDVPIEIIDDGSTSNETRIGAVNDLLFALETLNLTGDSFVLAGDNVLDFSFRPFFDYFRRKNANVAMRYFEPDVATLSKRGVLELGENDRVLAMEEKPAIPKTQWCVPPFYCYRDLTAAKVRAALADGCGFDAPGSLLAWICQKEPTFAWKMSGQRFDVGDLASYEKIQTKFKKVGR